MNYQVYKERNVVLGRLLLIRKQISGLDLGLWAVSLRLSGTPNIPQLFDVALGPFPEERGFVRQHT